MMAYNVGTMQYQRGDIWQLQYECQGWIVIPTNTTIRQDGRAVMGAGLAKQAADRYPELAKDLGDHIRVFDDVLFTSLPIVCLPTKHDWRRPSQLRWIERGCIALKEFADLLTSVNYHNAILLPQLGCGLGGLDWERQVRPMIDSILEGDRFVLVQYDD